MKRGIFIFSTASDSYEDNLNTGVGKKIASQIKALKREFEVDIDINHTRTKAPSFLERIKLRLPYSAVGVNWKYSNKYAGYDFVYFRKDVVDYRVYRFLSDIKKYNPHCKVIVEIATYPYDKEVLRRFVDIPFYLKDVINRKRLKKCVDRIVTFSPDTKIFGVNTIRTINGIDFSKLSKRKITTDMNTIHMIAVSSFAKMHGEDRLVEGLNEYYNINHGNRNVVVHLVGKGENCGRIKKSVEEYNLCNHVIFHGFLNKKELDDVYDEANVAVNSLGLHRMGVKSLSTLKSREYGAKGLPIVSASSIDYIESDDPYFLKVPSDESPVNIQSIIDFFDKIYNSGIDARIISETIRKKSQDKCDISVTMIPVCDYINGEK